MESQACFWNAPWLCMKAWLNAVELNVCLRQFKDRLRSVACLLDCRLKSTTTFKPVNGGFSLQWGQCGFYFLPVVLWSRFHLCTVIAPSQSGDFLIVCSASGMIQRVGEGTTLLTQSFIAASSLIDSFLDNKSATIKRSNHLWWTCCYYVVNVWRAKSNFYKPVTFVAVFAKTLPQRVFERVVNI